jgi:hypothetical protein
MLRLLPLFMSAFSGDIEASIQRRKVNAVLYAVAGLLFLTSWIVAIAALVVVLTPTYGPVISMAAVVAGLAGFALLLLVAVAVRNAIHSRRRKSTADKVTPLIALAAVGVAPALARSSPLLAVVATLGAAYFGAKLLGEDRDSISPSDLGS